MRNFSQKNRALSLMTIAAVVAGMVLPVLSTKVDAAGVAVTVTPDTATTATATTPVVSYTTAEAYTTGDTVTVSYDAGYTVTGVELDDATTPFAAPVTCVAGASAAVCTLGATDSVAIGDVLNVTVTASAAPATAGSYAFSLVSSLSEYGAALQYVSGDNQVTVSANVTPSLSFNIRTLEDDGDINICDLGTVTTSSLPNGDLTDDGAGECGYALAVGTNAQAGFQVQVASDDLLNNASASIANVANDTAWAAGTEAYGLDTVVSAGTGRNEVTGLYDVTVTEDGDFAADTTPVPGAATNFVSYTDGIEYTAGTDALDTTRVMHGMTIGSGTPAGYYDQIVTYTVTANF